MNLKPYSLAIFTLLLFFGSAVFLTLRQESLLHQADQNFVAAGYLHPEDLSDNSFFLTQQADSPRSLTLEYRSPDQSLQTEELTLAPHEKRILTPEGNPAITVRYQDQANQEQAITLYKK